MNLDAKAREPLMKLTRVPHHLALAQALFILGHTTTSHSIQDLYNEDLPLISKRQFLANLFEEAVRTNNSRAFFYLLHSNLDFNAAKLAFHLIRLRKVDFISEMCRQGHKFNMKEPGKKMVQQEDGSIIEEESEELSEEDMRGPTAIEFAVGRIPDDQFTCFFYQTAPGSVLYRAGRLNYAIDEDKAIMDRLIATMTDPSVINVQKDMKKLPDVSIYVMEFDSFPKSKYLVVRPEDAQPTSAPKFGAEYDISERRTEFVYPTSSESNPEIQLQLEVTFDGKASYVGIKESTLQYSSTIKEIFGTFNEDDEIAPLPLTVTDKEAFVIVMAFIRGLDDGEESNCDIAVPVWISNLMGGFDTPMLFRVFDVAKYLGINKIYSALAHFMNETTAGLSVEEIRYLISTTPKTVFRFGDLNFKPILDTRGTGVGEI